MADPLRRRHQFRRFEHVGPSAPRDPADADERGRAARPARRARRARDPVRQPLPARVGARQRPAGARDALGRRDAADRGGPRPRRHPDAQPGDVRDDVDGARGAADHRREPPPQLHRPRRVSADGGDRAALHPHAREPVQRAGRDDRGAHPGLLGGDHARRAVAEVEVAQAARGGRQGRRLRPNLVFGGDVHVVWEKFCRYFDVEPRIIPLQPDKYTIGPEDVEPHVDENTIGVAAVLGTTFTGPRRRHRRASTTCWSACATRRGSTSRCTSTVRAAASCGRSSTPTRSGTSGSSRCARSTCRATSTGSSTRASAG